MNNVKSLSSRFLSAYDHLDQFMRHQLQQDIESGEVDKQNRSFPSHAKLLHAMAKKGHAPIQLHRDDLFRYASLRNAISHNPDRENADPIAEPHEWVVARYEKLVEDAVNPARAEKCAIPRDKVFTATLTDSVLTVIRKMNEKVYTHVPVLEAGRLIGVFSENAFFSFLAVHDRLALDPGTTLADFAAWLPVDEHASEWFAFIPPKTLLAEVGLLFREKLKQNKRLASVFITSDGTSTGMLIGMLTAWDIAGGFDD